MGYQPMPPSPGKIVQTTPIVYKKFAWWPTRCQGALLWWTSYYIVDYDCIHSSGFRSIKHGYYITEEEYLVRKLADTL